MVINNAAEYFLTTRIPEGWGRDTFTLADFPQCLSPRGLLARSVLLTAQSDSPTIAFPDDTHFLGELFKEVPRSSFTHNL